MRFALCLLAAAACRAWAQDLSGAPDGATLPLVAEVPSPPIAVPAGGQFRIAYELHLTNWSSHAIVLTSITVAPSTESPGFTFEGEALEHSLVGISPDAKYPRRIAPGGRAAVFFFLSASGVPAQFFHRIRFHSAGREEELLTGATPVRANELVIQPPVRGTGWRILNGPGSNSHHRRGTFPFAGRLVVPQRWAIDFLQVNEQGLTHTGDAKVNGNYRCYGAEAVAVGDATVHLVKDGIPENVPHITERAVPMGWDTVSGNFVLLDLGSGRFAFYGHLQPGSIRVKAGDRVKAGQVLGRVGNSGNSTEPHLHFHVSDGLALGGDGLPFAIDAFTKEGVPHEKEIPLGDWVVNFR